MTKDIYVVCNKEFRFPILATDSYELAELKLSELATDSKRSITDYYIDEIGFYTND